MYRSRTTTRMNRNRFDSNGWDSEKFKKRFERMLDNLLDAADDEFQKNRGDTEGLIADLHFKDAIIEASLSYPHEDELFYDYIRFDGKFRDDLYEVFTDLKKKLLARPKKTRSGFSLSYEENDIYDLGEKGVREAYRTVLYKTLMLY